MASRQVALDAYIRGLHPIERAANVFLLLVAELLSAQRTLTLQACLLPGPCHFSHALPTKFGLCDTRLKLVG